MKCCAWVGDVVELAEWLKTISSVKSGELLSAIAAILSALGAIALVIYKWGASSKSSELAIVKENLNEAVRRRDDELQRRKDAEAAVPSEVAPLL
jgi:hypothetical protein